MSSAAYYKWRAKYGGMDLLRDLDLSVTHTA